MTATHVLVVDDEPQILRALRTNLRGAGYEVTTAATGEEALSAAAMRPPEAVILDLVLPDTRGTDVCRELRTWSTVPVIVLSAVGDEDEKVAALDAGADDYVTKPFGMGELLARLRAAMRRVPAASEPVIEIAELRVDVPNRAVSVAGRPDWVFVKLHTHGALERNAAVLLGPAMFTFHETIGRAKAMRPAVAAAESMNDRS